MSVINIGLNIVFLILSLIPQYYIYRKIKKSRNLLNIVVFIYILLIQIFYITDLLTFFESPLLFGERLTRNNFFLVLICSFELEFFFFLMGYKRFYTFPIISGFYMIFFLILIDSLILLIIYTLFCGLIGSLYLIWQGKHNNNGYILFLGICIFLMGLGFNFLGTFFEQLIHISALFFLVLGTSGFIDKHLMSEKEHIEKIKNAWITKIVEETNEL